MNFDLLSLRRVGQDVIDTTADAALGLVYDPEHPYDSMSMVPFVGAPFGYHQWRQGRSSKVQTLLSIALSVGTTEAIFAVAGRSAGYTSLEWGLGRGLSLLGVRYGGRSYTMGAIFGSRAGHAATFGWSPPAWFIGLLAYEMHQAGLMPYQTWDLWFYDAIHLGKDRQW